MKGGGIGENGGGERCLGQKNERIRDEEGRERMTWERRGEVEWFLGTDNERIVERGKKDAENR